MAWFGLGLFWRFSNAGRVASGEKLLRPAETPDTEWKDEVAKSVDADGYLIKSGRFLYIYLWTMFGVAFAAIAFCSVCSVVCCSMSGKDKEDDDDESADEVWSSRNSRNSKRGD